MKPAQGPQSAETERRDGGRGLEAVLEFAGLAKVQLPPRPLHLAIGMFDGVHLGHRAVIGAAVDAARASDGLAAVLTFWPHPSALFQPDHPTRLIQDPPAKARVLAELGVDAIITEGFTPEVARIPAPEFLGWLKIRLPHLAAIYVGENFRFGRGRSGDIAVLGASARQLGLSMCSTPRVTVDGEPVSSTRIRGLLAAGDIRAANRLLGYAYFADGVVTPGKRLGRSIGFPTLNVPWSPGLRPRLGVYVAQVSGAKSPRPIPGVANYGVRPTVEKVTEPQLEIHVLGDCPFGAGDRISVEWLDFLRPEMKFAGVEALRAQIALDRASAETFFARS